MSKPVQTIDEGFDRILYGALDVIRNTFVRRENDLLARIRDLEQEREDIQRALVEGGYDYTLRAYDRSSLYWRVRTLATRVRRAEAACRTLKSGVVPAVFFSRRSKGFEERDPT